MIRISEHLKRRCLGRLSSLVSVAEVEAALSDLIPMDNQTWVKVKDLGERVRIHDGNNYITGDIVWVIVRGTCATTVMIRRDGQSCPADRVIGV